MGRYLRRVSGPLLDRIDLQVEVPAVEWEELRGEPGGPTTAEVRERVRFARRRAAGRLAADGGGGREGFTGAPSVAESEGGARTNADMGVDEVRRHCRPGPEAEALIRRGVEEHGLSARGYHRLLKVARTVADLEGEADITATHVAEALQYRLPERAEG